MASIRTLRKMRTYLARISTRSVEILTDRAFRERKILSRQPLPYLGMQTREGIQLRMASSQGEKQTSP